MGCINHKVSFVGADHDFCNTWQPLERVGEGSLFAFCDVKCKRSGRIEAMKCLDMNQLKIDDLKEEARLWRKLGRHENVVHLIEAGRLDSQYYAMVMEKCEYSLDGLIDNMPMASEADMAYIASQMLSGIRHLHSREIVHRDIKPANLVYGRGRGRPLKLCDFGKASAIPPSGCLFGTYGTPSFMSPEMVGIGPHDMKTDIWSAGVVCYRMFFGSLPYAPVCKDAQAIMQTIAKGTPEPGFQGPRETTDTAKEFVSTLLHRPMRSRTSAKKLLRLSFLRIRPTKMEGEILMPVSEILADNFSDGASLDCNMSDSIAMDESSCESLVYL